MYTRKTKNTAEFHHHRCFALLKKIAATIPLDDEINGGINIVGDDEDWQFLKDFRDQFTRAKYQSNANYHEILQKFLLKMEIRLNKNDDFFHHDTTKKILHMLFAEHSFDPPQAVKTRELTLGTLADRHGKYAGVSPLFLAWMAHHAPERPPPVKQRDIIAGRAEKDVLLLYLDILPVQQDDDPAFKALMEKIKEKYDYEQVVGMIMPHDLLLKHHEEFQRAHQYSREQLVKMITSMICERDGAFFLQGGMAMTMGEENIREMVEKSMLRLSMDTQKNFSKEEALVLYFHLIKYEMVQDLMMKYHPQFLTFTTKDRQDRVNIASAYHALVQSIEYGEPLTRAQFNAVLFAPEHEERRVRHDQMAIIWKAINAYISSMRLRGMDVPEWLPKWMDKHVPERGRAWYAKKLGLFISAKLDDTMNTLKVVSNSEKSINPGDLGIFKSIVNAEEGAVLCAQKLKAILDDPVHTKGGLTEDDFKVIDRVKELKDLCEEMKKDHIIDFHLHRTAPLRRV